MLVLIVPYRAENQPERKQQLDTFVDVMPRLLPEARIVIAEQADTLRFNRGLLFNACVKELGFKAGDQLCLHDVDMIPEGSIVGEYTRKLDADTTRHIGHAAAASLDRYKAVKVSASSFGGISLMHAPDYARVNGFPNDFWGWGGEDCVLGLRVSRIQHPALSIERTRGVLRDLENISSHQDKMAQLKASKGMGKGVQTRTNRYRNGSLFANGLAEARYTVVATTVRGNIWHLKIDCTPVRMHLASRDTPGTPRKNAGGGA